MQALPDNAAIQCNYHGNIYYRKHGNVRIDYIRVTSNSDMSHMSLPFGKYQTLGKNQRNQT